MLKSLKLFVARWRWRIRLGRHVLIDADGVAVGLTLDEVERVSRRCA